MPPGPRLHRRINLIVTTLLAVSFIGAALFFYGYFIDKSGLIYGIGFSIFLLPFYLIFSFLFGIPKFLLGNTEEEKV